MSDNLRFVRCKRCNRPLKTNEAQLCGYGPKCYKIIIQEQKSKPHNIFERFNKGEKI